MLIVHWIRESPGSPLYSLAFSTPVITDETQKQLMYIVQKADKELLIDQCVHLNFDFHGLSCSRINAPWEMLMPSDEIGNKSYYGR